MEGAAMNDGDFNTFERLGAKHSRPRVEEDEVHPPDGYEEGEDEDCMPPEGGESEDEDGEA